MRTIRPGESARSGPPRFRLGSPWSSPDNMALSCSDTAGPTAPDPAPWAVAVPGGHLTEQARNAISRDHHCATWRLPLRRLGAAVAPAAGWPCTYRGQQRSAAHAGLALRFAAYRSLTTTPARFPSASLPTLECSCRHRECPTAAPRSSRPRRSGSWSTGPTRGTRCRPPCGSHCVPRRTRRGRPPEVKCHQTAALDTGVVLRELCDPSWDSPLARKKRRHCSTAAARIACSCCLPPLPGPPSTSSRPGSWRICRRRSPSCAAEALSLRSTTSRACG